MLRRALVIGVGDSTCRIVQQQRVAEQLAADDAVALLRTDSGVKFRKQALLERIEEEQRCQMEGRAVEQNARQQAQIHQERMPLVAAHQLLGEPECVLRGDIRVLREDVRDHAVLVILDEAADDGQIPERLADRPQEHDLGGIFDRIRPVDEQQPVGAGRVVQPPLQEVAAASDQEDILDEDPVERQQNDHHEDRHRLLDRAVKEDLVQTAQNAESQRTGCGDLVDDDGEIAHRVLLRGSFGIGGEVDIDQLLLPEQFDEDIRVGIAVFADLGDSLSALLCPVRPVRGVLIAVAQDEAHDKHDHHVQEVMHPEVLPRGSVE